jgi:hypothetical protein
VCSLYSYRELYGLEAWAKIKEDGELRSVALLRSNGVNFGGIGLRAFGEPEDYAEYVMLTGIDGIGPEHVVASWKRGCVFTEENTPYQPGARLYFDGHRMIQDDIVISDGLHTFKVHDRLPLEPYLVTAVTAVDVDPYGEMAEWTPRSFLDRANEYFVDRFGAG